VGERGNLKGRYRLEGLVIIRIILKGNINEENGSVRTGIIRIRLRISGGLT
jgi:hypothetical protein